MTAKTRIALIHAVTVAIDPVRDSFATQWPEAELVNILDDSLSVDRAREAALTPAITERIMALGRYALSSGADGILYTCSAFGPAIEAFARQARVPVLKPNEAMFAEALGRGSRIGMLASFHPSVATLEEEFHEAAAGMRRHAGITTIVVPEAMAALKAGDAARHNALLAEAAPRLGPCDAIMLAQFSTARALDAVAGVVGCPVLSSPRTAVAALRQRCG